MAAKTIIVICAQALLIKAVLSQFLGSVTGNSVVDNNIILGNNIAGGLSSGLIGNAISGVAGAGNTFANAGGILGNGFSGLNSAAAISSQTGLNAASSMPFIVTSSSPIYPTGISIASDNTLDGILTVTGQLPYLGVVAFDGSLPTAGTGFSTCGCGNGQVGMVNEGLSGASSNVGLNAVNARVGRQ